MIRISRHAIDKFLEDRGQSINHNEDELTEIEKDILSDAEHRILDIYRESEEEEMHAGLVKRYIVNQQPAKYYRNGKWRIVVCGDTMVTIEVNTFDFTGIGISKNDSRRRNKKEWKYNRDKRKKYRKDKYE